MITFKKIESCSICGGETKLIMSDLFDDRYGAPGKHKIFQCLKCGFGRINPGISEKEIGLFYAKYYPLGNANSDLVRKSAEILPKWKAWILGVDNICHRYASRGLKVLDIGSASGVSLLEIKMLGAESYGVEPDPNSKHLAQELGITVFTGQITDNPFPGLTFDMITSSQVIEHSPDPQKFLKAVNRKINSKGIIVLSFPNLNTPYRMIFGKKWIHWHVPYHYNFFTLNSFKILAKEAGFKIVKVRTITPNLWTLIQLHMVFIASQYGKMHPLWEVQHSLVKKDIKLRALIVRKSLYLLSKIFLVFIFIINRTIDALGLGESFIVWMKKENE